MGFTERCNRRLQREVIDLLNKSASENSSCGICFELPNEDDITKLTAYLQGPQNSPYEKGIFALSVEFPVDYPMSPPKIKFNTKIWHPNISSVTGAVCLNTLSSDWTPSLSVFACMLSIRTLLLEPAPDDPQDSMVASQFKDDIGVYKATAKYWTNEFASRHDNYENLDDAIKVKRQKLEVENPEEREKLETYKKLHEKIMDYKISRNRALEALCLENWNLERAMEQLNIVFKEPTLPMLRPSASTRKKSIPKSMPKSISKSIPQTKSKATNNKNKSTKTSSNQKANTKKRPTKSSTQTQPAKKQKNSKLK